MAVRLTPFILSGTVLKLFAGILMSEIVMGKPALKIGMIMQRIGMQRLNCAENILAYNFFIDKSIKCHCFNSVGLFCNLILTNRPTSQFLCY